MKLLKSPIFIICCVLFVAHQVVQHLFGYEIAFIDSYLDMLLAMPIILTLLLAERIYLFKWKEYERLSLLEVIVATIFIALVVEVLFPVFSEQFTTDWLDIIFLLAGAALFYHGINPKGREIAN